MGFRVANNVSALQVRINLFKNQKGLARSIERLSSGFRINRGADDPSGLTLSEKLRTQIRGTNEAIGNAQNGISVLQTAEGALAENSELLNRIRELSIQAQSDALTVNDRIEIQKEVDQAILEIDSLASGTEFNTRSLLDGSASARVSSSTNQNGAVQIGGDVEAGDYHIEVLRTSLGERQAQKSAIQTDSTTGLLASLNTELRDLDSMTDSGGVPVLEDPLIISLRGNKKKADITVTGAMTTGELATAIEDSLKSGSGLDLPGATFAFNPTTGQFSFQSGKDGQSGDITISGDEDFVNALSMQVTQESRDPGYRISSTQIDVQNPETTQGQTTTERAIGVIDGLAIDFSLAKEARIDGTLSGQRGIQIGANNVVFTFHDTNAQDNGQATGNISAGVTVTLTGNRTYTTTSIQSIVNLAVNGSADSSNALTRTTTSSLFSTPGITASFSGFDLQLTSSVTGTSGEISLTANAEAQSLLGLTSGKVVGSSGNSAILAGTVDVSSGISIAGTGVLRVRVGDGDFRINSGTSIGGEITFNRGALITSASITSTLNTYFTSNNIDANASVDSSGFLNIATTETGGDARLSISSGGSSLGDLGLIDGQTASGNSGSAAVFSRATNANAEVDSAFVLGGFMKFRVADESGIQTNTITFGTSNVASSGESFAISQTQLSSILDTSGVQSTGVDYSFDAGNRLDFFSSSIGKTSRVTLTSDATSQTLGSNTFGIDFNSQAQGSGATEFDIHVTDSKLNFQVGANRGQSLGISFANSSVDALGLRGLDVTNIKTATRALAKIDNAVNQVSSERSRLGSFENRLSTSVDNLTSATTHLTSFESQIRDVDIAKETVDFTRSQILVQAGTAQLIQANALGQTALTLLF